MVDLLLWGSLGVPLLVGLSMLILAWRRHDGQAYWITLGVMGFTALCVSALLPFAEQEISLGVSWIPNTGVMSLSLGTTGLYAALVTTWGGFLVLLGTTPRREDYTLLTGALTLVALAAANAAFVAGHFLGRYVALEVVGLCIAMAPLVLLGRTAGPRLTKFVYIILRVGDAGFLAAILLLMHAGDTLDISPALEAGSSMAASRLAWAVAGFLLAVWVKVGAWPFHIWLRAGRKLPLASQAWLYATVMPNLGLYLLYRITPLLVLNTSMSQVVLWLGVGSAVLSMLIALSQDDLRASLISIGAAQGALALFVAAGGEKYVVWLGLLVITPLRLLAHLAADMAEDAKDRLQRRVAAGLLGLSGLLLTAFTLLVAWWMHEAGAPSAAMWLVDLIVALTGIWAVQSVLRLVRVPSLPAQPVLVPRSRNFVVVGLATLALACGLGFRPLTPHLVEASGVHLPEVPSSLALLRYAVSSPVIWLAVAAAFLAARFSWQAKLQHVSAPEETYNPEKGLLWVANTLRRWVEAGVLEHSVSGSAKLAVGGARFFSRAVEHDGLEGFLGSVVSGLGGVSSCVQSWHTGKLRYNLLWVLVVFVFALLMLALVGW